MDGETQSFSTRNLCAGFLIIGERIAQGRSRPTLSIQTVKKTTHAESSMGYLKQFDAAGHVKK